MLTILHVFTCDYCGFTRSESEIYQDVLGLRLDRYVPSGWNLIDSKLVCKNHDVAIDPIEDQQ